MKKVINLLIYLVLILPALVFSPWQINSFELPKNAFFLIVISWVTLLYLIYKGIKKPDDLNNEQKIIIGASLALIILKFISLLFSPNKDLSFWGSFIRQEGFITNFFLIVFFLILIRFLTEFKQIKNYSLAICSVSGFISLYGVLQKFKIDFLSWEDNAYIRIASTLGNPLFLSSFLLFTIFYSLYCLKVFSNLYLKLAIGLSLILQLLALFFTASSSSYLALIGIILFGLIIYFWPKKKIVSVSILSLGIIGVVLVTLILVGVINFQPINKVLADFSPQNQSNLQRLLVWDSAYRAFLIKPIFGWGNELFSNAFDYTKNTTLLPPLESNYDRAHNIILDIAVSEGILVLMAFLFIIIFSLYTSIKKYFANKNIIYLLTGSLIIGFMINFCFTFPGINNYILLYFTLALIFFQPQDESTDNETFNFSIGAIGLIILLMLNWLFIKPVLADLLFKKNLTETDGLKKASLMAKAISYWPYKEYKIELFKLETQIMGQLAKSNPQLANSHQQKNQLIVDDLLKKYPNNYTVNLLAAKHYSTINQIKMNEYFNSAITLAPKRQDIYWYWGDLFLNSTKPELAIDKYQQAINIDPAQAYPYFKMSELYTKLKNQDKANDYLKQAQDHGWK